VIGSRNIPTSTARSVWSLLAVDQEFGEGATLRVASELADRVGPLEVGAHQYVAKLGAWSRPEGVEARPQSGVELVGTQLLSSLERAGSWGIIERPRRPRQRGRPLLRWLPRRGSPSATLARSAVE
jgi:hypothetical protein